ncbi:phosphatase [Nostoc sp. 3335mG]|nr:phosphatase [Nostoc sp. 3335mG]
MSELFAAFTDGSGHPRKWPAAMRVCSQTEARRNGAEWGPTHIISIYGPESRYLGLPDFDQSRQLHARFEDVGHPGDPGAPTLAHVEAIFAFVDALPRDARLLIHCLQGRTRAAAVALGILARYLPADKAGQAVFRAFADASPNPLVVSLFDKALGLEGKLIKAGRKFPSAGLRQAVA